MESSLGFSELSLCSPGQRFTPLGFKLLLCTRAFYCKTKWDRSEVRDPNCRWTVSKYCFTSPGNLSKASPRTQGHFCWQRSVSFKAGVIAKSTICSLILGAGSYRDRTEIADMKQEKEGRKQKWRKEVRKEKQKGGKKEGGRKEGRFLKMLLALDLSRRSYADNNSPSKGQYFEI